MNTKDKEKNDMKTILETLSAFCGQAFAACGYPEEFGAVTESDRPDICQFQ